MNQDQLYSEFERQVENLIDKDYPALSDLSKEVFVKKLEPLKEKLNGRDLAETDLEKGKLPFVIVVKNSLASAEEMMSKVQRDGKNGVTILRPHISKNFQTITEVELPKPDMYLLLDIDRGKESLNVRPRDAFVSILNKNRSPLTIDEGIALITHFPEFLMKNNCFSLLASRKSKSQSVPAIWINAKKEPNLGWCWDGNPHTWLGSASCEARIS